MADRRTRGGLAVSLALALAAGCAVGPDYLAPAPDVPDVWEMELTRGLAEGEASLQTWWTVFGDPTLDVLVERAVEGNLDLELALERVDEARAQRGFARGAWFPSIFGTGDYRRDRLSGEVLNVPGLGGNARNLYNVGLDTSWEIDVFGRVRRSVESANAGLEASIEDYRDTLVLLLADVAATYVELRTAQLRLHFAESNAELQRGTLQLTRDRNNAGLSPDLDVRQAELNLAETESAIPRFRQQIREGLHRLGVLIGRPPGTLVDTLSQRAPIPEPPTEVLVGTPYELLRQRPDVRSAERELAAQTARVGVATADLYPRLALLGTFGFQAQDAAKLFTGGAGAFSFGPSLRWNLFDGGRVRANIGIEEARTEQALTFYEQTVLLALEEAENSMVAYEREQDRRDALERSVVAAAASVDLVTTLYRTGLTDFQNVLDMERSLTRQQDFLATSQGQVAVNLIRVYKALGGGWTP